MSWRITKEGSVADVKEAVADEIRKSVSYDDTMAQKGEGVVEASDKLIDSVSVDLPEGKQLQVTSAGHISGTSGDTSFSFAMRYIDAVKAADQGEGSEA